MKFKLDENMPSAPASYLAGGAPDPSLLSAAVAEQRTLLTFDVDFADIRRYPPESHCGVIVFRLSDQRWSALSGPVEQLLTRLEKQGCDGALIIVEKDRIRRRRK